MPSTQSRLPFTIRHTFIRSIAPRAFATTAWLLDVWWVCPHWPTWRRRAWGWGRDALEGPATALVTSSNRLPNRLWGRLRGPFPSNASLGWGMVRPCT